MRLLVVEDSESLCRSLKLGLERSGFAVDTIGDGNAALAYVLCPDYDVIVLDLMLPGRGGLSLLKELRAQGLDTHVLILSARDQTKDRVEGLRLGADDYLVKPFSFDELLARLRALLRRRYHSKQPTLHIGELSIDTEGRLVRSGNGEVDLSPREYAVLEALCLHPGQVLSRDQLIARTTGCDRAITDNAVEVLISSLRRKLRSVGAADLIRTKRGFGYYVGS